MNNTLIYLSNRYFHSIQHTNQYVNWLIVKIQVEDILRQLKENPDVLPVVSLPPAKPAADSLSPNRTGTTTATSSIASGSVDSVDTSIRGPQGSLNDVVQAVAAPVVASAVPLAAGLHSRSASLDGSDVCHTAPTDSAVSAALATVQSQTTTPNLVPLSISNPGIAVTVDGGTPPVVAIPAPQFPTIASHPTPAAPAEAAPPVGGLVESTEPVTPKVF